MKYRRLDPNGDYSFGRGGQDFTQDIDAIAQAIKTKLLLLQGEWWEDTGEGLPLFQHILGVAGNEEGLSGADLLIQERILQTPGVTTIDNYNRTYTDRAYSVSCDVNTVYGSTSVSTTLL
jgi:hypothetical protein